MNRHEFILRFTLSHLGVSSAIAGEVATLAAEATPYVTAAVGAYGGAVLAKVPDDADVLASLRLAIRRQLEADAAMLADVRMLLASAPGTTVNQRIRAGRDAYVAGRDMTINRPS
jgi:hypothetical protein